MKQAPFLTRQRILRLTGYTAVATLLLLMFTFRLGTLFSGVSASEVAAANASSSIQTVLSNASSFPHKVLIYGLGELGWLTTYTLRLMSVGFFGAAVVLFYLYSRRKFSARISIFGTLAFSTSSVLLAIGRNGGFLSSAVFSVLAVLYATELLAKPKGFTGKGWFCGTLIALALFSPAALIALALLLTWHAPKLVASVRVWPSTALLPVILLPLISVGIIAYSGYQTPSSLLTILGLPNQIPTISQIGTHAAQILQLPFFRSPTQSEYFLARTPVLDVFTAICLILGVAYYQTKTNPKRLAALAAVTVLLIGYFSLSDITTALPVFLPAFYVSIAAGITLLLRQWLSIFPFNPFARTAGVVVITVVVAISGFYQLSRYFVAFSQTPANRQAAQQQLPDRP